MKERLKKLFLCMDTVPIDYAVELQGMNDDLQERLKALQETNRVLVRRLVDVWEQIDMLYPGFRDYYNGLMDDRKVKEALQQAEKEV